MSNKEPKIEILHETDSYLIVNKPSGLMVHPDGRQPGPFVTDWVLKKYPGAKGVGEPSVSLDGSVIDRPGIVHRLDRDTSGVLIIAKTAEAHAFFKEKFQNRTIYKKYLAFIWGIMDDEFGTITKPIGRDGSDFRKWSAQRGARGDLKEAETYWTRVADWKPEEPQNELERAGFALIEAEPKTGRTHQIRVHMNAIHHPLVGDMLYAPKRPYVLGFDRLALHSWKVEFTDEKGKNIKVECPLPKDFEHALELTKIKLRTK